MPDSERQQLISPAHIDDSDTEAGSESGETRQPKFADRDLDIMPEKRDKLALALIGCSIALFLSLTWYLVFSQDLKALGYFAPHPPLQSLGITAFLLGIIPLQPPTPSISAKRTARFNIHQRVMLGLALPAMAFGTASMWWNKHVHGARHFTTWHSWFGLATVGWLLLQALLGGASVWFNGNLLGGPGKAKGVYKYHRISGYLLIALSLATAHLGGAHSDWALSRPGGEMKWVRLGSFWVGIPLLLLGVYMRIRPNKMKLM